MHMANELLSLPVAGGTLVIAGGVLGFICKAVKKSIAPEKMILMGLLGAFIFAGQMVNFRLPAMPGTSGHMIGAVLMAIILGPGAAAIVISSVVIIQCFIFQDGGLLSLGCNIINMAIVPSYVGYYLYRLATAEPFSNLRTYFGTILACLVAVELGAVLVPLEAAASGVLSVPLSTFLVTMLGVHFIVGISEGVITVAVLAFIQQTRPDIVADKLPGRIRLSKRVVFATFAILTVITGTGLSLLASGMPDGLEWSYAERPDQPHFEPIVSNSDSIVEKVNHFQSKYSLMPDYTVKSRNALHSSAAGWTSLAGVFGSVATMLVIWLTVWVLRRKSSLTATA